MCSIRRHLAGGIRLGPARHDVGQDLSFRPYVSDALAHGRGRFYGVGITSRKPGYYLSYALRRRTGRTRRGGRQRSTRGAERAWRKLPGDVVLIDSAAW